MITSVEINEFFLRRMLEAEGRRYTAGRVAAEGATGMKYTEREKGSPGFCRTSIATLEIDDLDMVKVRLDEFDRRLLDECGKSTKISDKLLALETITRRIEESQ